ALNRRRKTRCVAQRGRRRGGGEREARGEYGDGGETCDADAAAALSSGLRRRRAHETGASVPAAGLASRSRRENVLVPEALHVFPFLGRPSAARRKLSLISRMPRS